MSGRHGWKRRVFELRGARCVPCRARGRSTPARQAHHAVKEQNLPPELRWDERNGVPVCLPCHGAHTSMMRPIRYSELPADVVAWAAENGLSWALTRQYPGAP